jgi:hypothetical protein
MDFSRLTNPQAYKDALAGLLRRGGEVTDFIATAPEKAGQAILEGHEKNKALQAQAFANPNRPFQVTNKQAMGELGDRMLAGPLSVAPVGMIAYHGTPHLIKDKFDISKVGTGEGAQAYGHGMYFAESPSVANAYKGSDEVKILADGKVTESPVAKQIVKFGGDSQAFIKSLENKLNNQKQVLQKASKDEVLPNISDYDIAKMDLDATLKMIDEAKSYKSVKSEPVGNLYKVDIPDEYIPKMLDYDKPIKDQAEIYELIKNNIKDPAILNSFIYNAEKGNISGANAYANYIGGKKASEKSQNALALGIKGIRYLDEGSRAKGGTSNFVVFDPTDVKLLERNNQPISRKELIQQQIDKIE